ncbi:hypothetical protein CDL12_26282 [Handroanthus impetiginosus]|uniref:Arabinogalactan peptide n=1 Tax=Handroanthus impetiginosus TaxID=429701 RepID=A0A2G9G8B3_9LAMI|nr:hypothetical protein CDL12_26282 [Handroanthus impetiginosus]
MEVFRFCFVVAIFALLSALAINAQVPEPAPAPSSDGVALDQGIAYMLMLVALAITYIVH